MLDRFPDELDTNARVGIRKNSTGATSRRRRVNLIEGSGVTLTVADDPADEEIDVTIAASTSVAAAGRAKNNAGTVYYGVPGTGFVGTTTYTVANAARIYYVPWTTQRAVDLTETAIEVTTAGASTRTLRCAVYAADSDLQPTGSALIDETFTWTGSTGVMTNACSASLAAGTYLTAYIVENTGPAYRVWLAPTTAVPTSMGTGLANDLIETSGSYSTSMVSWPSSSNTWATLNTVTSNYGWRHLVLFKWTPA